MCLECANMNADIRQQQGTITAFYFNSSEFEVWNTSSVLNLLYHGVGVFGPSTKDLAVSTLRDFIQWIKTNKTVYYLPINSFELMYHPELLTQLTDWCETYTGAISNSSAPRDLPETEEKEETGRVRMHINEQMVHVEQMRAKWRTIHQNLLETNTWYYLQTTWHKFLVTYCRDWYYGGRIVYARLAP